MATKKQQRQVRAPTELASIEHGCFDTAALQQELAQALEDDRLYKLTDSMKKRAIHTAANYDDFKNLVACADLKPISQKELQSLSRSARPATTNLTYKPKTRTEFGKTLRFATAPADLDTAPATAAAFCRNWRRYLKTPVEKLRYLERTTAPRLGALFKSDLDADLFADVVDVLTVTWPSSDDATDERVAFARDALEALASTDRFALVLDFLDNNQLETAQRLVRLVDAHATSVDTDRRVALRASYRLSSA